MVNTIANNLSCVLFRQTWQMQSGPDGADTFWTAFAAPITDTADLLLFLGTFPELLPDN